MSKNMLLRLALLLALALVAAACGGEEDPQGSDPTSGEGDGATEAPESVSIAYMGPLTGNYAALGQNMVRGVKYAVDQANESGELGFDLKVVEFDSQGLPDQAPALAQQIAQDQSIVALVGPSFSGETNAAGPVLNEGGIPFVSPSATNPELTEQGWDFFFRTVATDATQGPVVAQFISESLGLSKVAVIDDSSDYGKGLADIVRTSLKERGAEVVYSSGVEAGQQDYSAIVGQVVQSGAEAVFFGGYYAEAGLIRRQLVDQGAEDMVFVSDDGTFDPQFITTAGEGAAEGAYVSFPGADPLSAEEEFRNATDPGAFTIEAYQNTLIVIEALKEVGSDRQAIRDFVDEFNGEVFGKNIEFDDNGDIAAQAFYIYQVVDGEWRQHEEVVAES